MSLLSEEFDKLCAASLEAFNEELDISYEETLINILNFVKQHPKDRGMFVEKFKAILLSRNSPFESVAFCMRELRWPEIKDFVIQTMNASDDPRSEALRTVVTAYDDEWPNADLYDYYS